MEGREEGNETRLSENVHAILGVEGGEVKLDPASPTPPVHRCGIVRPRTHPALSTPRPVNTLPYQHPALSNTVTVFWFIFGGALHERNNFKA